MKKLILTLAMMASSVFIANAQITINQSDMATIGIVIHMGVDTLSPIVVTPAGPNQTWTYALTPQDRQDSMFFLQPSLTPYGSINPTSNICFYQLPDTTYAYLISNPSSMTMIGMAKSRIVNGNHVTAYAHFSDDRTLMKFPTNYLDNFLDTSAFDTRIKYGYMVGTFLVDSLRIRNKTWITDTIDAWGNITTPLGTFPSLREKRIEISQDSLWAYAFGTWTDVTTAVGLGIDTLLTYSWYTPNMKYAIFQLVVDYATDTVRTASYMNTNPALGIADISDGNAKCVIYPNPANDILNIYSTMTGNNLIEIFDNTGNQIRKVSMNETERKINISDLSCGMYFLKMTNLKTQLSSSGKFSVVR
jgi:hypothetical protein